jgi:hypothetical protein
MAEKNVSKNTSNGMGVASLVLGIASIVFCWVPILGLVAGIVGLILAIKQRKESPNGIATGGLVTSIIGLVLSVIYTIFWLVVGSALFAMGGAV